MKKFFPLLILCSLIFISCKEKNIDIRFSGEGKFSHESLVKMIDEPEMMQPKESKKSKKEKKNAESQPTPEPVPMDFYGIDEKEMGDIIKSFGDCEGSGEMIFSVEVNGFSLKRIYIKKDSEFFFKFSSENILHEKIFETAEKMCDENPALVVTYAKDKKSFSVYCKFAEEYTLYDSAESEEEIKLSDFKDGGSPEGMKVKITDGKVIITGEDKELNSYVKFIVEQVKN